MTSRFFVMAFVHLLRSIISLVATSLSPVMLMENYENVPAYMGNLLNLLVVGAGIDLPTYMRMCISRLTQQNDIPITMNLNDLPENKAIKAMKSASRIAAENGLSDMTLDEINAEIAEARK